MNQIQITSSDDAKVKLAEFCAERNIKAFIGISGGSADVMPGLGTDPKLENDFLELRTRHHTNIITEAIKVFRGYPVAFLSGGTAGGVPEIAVKVAKSLGFPTVGVVPECGLKYVLQEQLDLLISVGSVFGESSWGDESSVWTSISDAVIVIGGSSGTLAECSHILKLNERRINKQLPVKFIVPIHDTGGFAEQIHNLWVKPAIRRESLPSELIYTGTEAAHILVNHLSLDDYFDPSSHG